MQHVPSKEAVFAMGADKYEKATEIEQWVSRRGGLPMMATGRLSRAKYLAQKGAGWMPRLISQPRLVMHAMRGVHLGELMTLDTPWLKSADINTVIDVGANTGQFASAVHTVLPRAKIYSFEPLPDCYSELSTRMAGVPSFRPFNVALGAETGSITFNQNTFSKSSSVLEMAPLHKQAYPWTAVTAPVTVQMQPLDDFCEELELMPEVLVKIDVQGYEDRVLRGGERVIRTASYVLIEASFQNLYNDQASFSAVYDILRSYGFDYAGGIDHLKSPIDGRVLQEDALFVRVNERL
jgi:FkbM family methyltransferase